MTQLNDRKLLNIIRYAPVVLISIFAVVVNIILIQNNRIESAEKVEFIRQNLIEQQKQIVQEQIKQVASQIERQKQLTEKTLQQQLRSRVNEAYSITANIYANHLDKPKSEVTSMITEALRPIRFNDGRGYLYIYDKNGVSVMHGLLPNLEGNSLRNVRDVRGVLIVQEHIAKIDAAGGEAFYRWWFKRPDSDPEKEFEKIGFGKYFAPLEWYIGTGDYVVDVELDIQKQVLEWLDQWRYGENDYVFAIDRNQKIISHPESSMKGQLINEELASQLSDFLASPDMTGRFTSYMASYMPGSATGGEKISYMQFIEGWDWIIGTGFYVERFEAYLAKNVKALEESNREELKLVSLASIISTLIIVGLSLRLGSVIADRFNRFQDRINKDFNELTQVRDKLRYLAEHDALTELPNRLVLTGLIHTGIDYAHKNDRCGAVMLLDLDDFKKINDLHGHSSGDRLLSIISRKFETLLGPHDTVSRFGGDEFIFCFPDLADQNEARQKVEQIRHVFSDKFIIDGKVMTTDCSIGVSMFPNDDNEPEALIRKADIVLYKSKALKKGHSMFYNHDINEEIQMDYMVEEALQTALKNNEISVLYQPQINVKNGQPYGVEALARWTSAKLGVISPAKFITVAEEIGLIYDIGLFVFRKACEDIHSVSPNGNGALCVSINISPKQLMEWDFTKALIDIVDDIGIDVNRITLEITENVLLEDLDTVSERLNEMRGHGFGVSLDDFGTGYSSLSYLNHLPITEIKIDRSFVDKMLYSSQTTTLVKSIIAIGVSSQMTVVAEGVETGEQMKALAGYGCDVVQGYHFDPPLAIEVLKEKYLYGSLSAQSNSDHS